MGGAGAAQFAEGCSFCLSSANGRQKSFMVGEAKGPLALDGVKKSAPYRPFPTGGHAAGHVQPGAVRRLLRAGSEDNPGGVPSEHLPRRRPERPGQCHAAGLPPDLQPRLLPRVHLRRDEVRRGVGERRLRSEAP